MKEIIIHRISYSPGYCDMMGGCHGVSLEKDSEGRWTYVCRDREDHSAPTVVSAYAVPEEAVARFAEFIRKNKVISLEKRPQSDLFITDYSPWSWNIVYDTSSLGKTSRKYCTIGEYKIYSRADNELLKKLREEFYALHGEKISETTEK